MATTAILSAPQLDLQQRRSRDEDDSDAELLAWHLMLGFVYSASIRSACMLQIPDLLAREGSLTLEEIASRLPSEAPDTDKLYRLLRFLCMKGFFSVNVEQNSVGVRPDSKYCITPVSKFFVQENNELGALALLLTSMESQAVAFHSHEFVLQADGIAFGKVHGTDMWSFANSNSSFNQLFNRAMAGLSNVVMKSILEHYHGFDNLGTIVDVGGGIGASMSLIKAQNPSIKAINFDLPHVIATAPSVSGIKHVAGDMFTSVPSADVIFMKWILHDWDDKDCTKILKNCRKAILKGGKLIIVEMVLETDEERAKSMEQEVKTQFDLVMTGALMGGKERNREEWQALLIGAGFSQSNVIYLPGFLFSVIEAFPDHDEGDLPK